MPKQIQLIIADDHTIVREGLIALMENEPDLHVVGQATGGYEAIRLIGQHQPHVALMDISMGDLNGLDATRRCKTKWPEVKIIILTMHEEEAFFFEALRAGASGYLLKETPGKELIEAIRAVYAGNIYLSPKIAGNLVQDYLKRQSPLPPPDHQLTARELEVLALIAQGLTNDAIAKRLTISLNTVKTHRLHIYEKLGRRNRAALVDYALEHGLLTA